MADPFRKAVSGEPLRVPARTWNTFLDAARAHRDRQEDVGREATPAVTDGGIVLLRNNTGAALAQFDVAALGLPIIVPADNEAEFRGRVTFEGGTPSVPEDLGEWAVVLEAIPTDGIGRARVSGLVQARLYAPVQPVIIPAEGDEDAFLFLHHGVVRGEVLKVYRTGCE